MSSLFEGSFLGDTGRLDRSARLECGICWQVYDPEIGDPVAQIPAGTAFADLPEDWTCPSCAAPRTKFMALALNAGTSADPLADAARVVTAYRAADGRMRGLPVHNPALDVEAVGFRGVEGGTAGIVITPWMMNIICVPAVSHGVSGDHVERAFPAGAMTMTVSELTVAEAQPLLVEACSLFSPMAEFGSMEAARIAAHAVLDALFTAEEPKPADAEAPSVPAPGVPAEPRAIDRRGFLTGRPSR